MLPSISSQINSTPFIPETIGEKKSPISLPPIPNKPYPQTITTTVPNNPQQIISICTSIIKHLENFVKKFSQFQTTQAKKLLDQLNTQPELLKTFGISCPTSINTSEDSVLFLSAINKRIEEINKELPKQYTFKGPCLLKTSSVLPFLQTAYNYSLHTAFGDLAGVPQNISLSTSVQLIRTWLKTTDLTKIETLILAETGLTCFPKEICLLTSLNYLDLASNSIYSFPKEIKSLTKLSELYVSENHLLSIPEEISYLKNLTILSLFSNELSSLPQGFGSLDHLICLDLQNNLLNSLPTTIGNLTALTELDLSDNSLSLIPEEFCTLKNLATLQLDDNTLTSLPHSINNLTNLHTLTLDHNFLQELPEELWQLITLEYLSLSHNELTFLSENIKNLTNLKEVDFAENPLTRTPK